MSVRDFKKFLLAHVEKAMFSEITGNYYILLTYIDYDYNAFMRFMDGEFASPGVSFAKTVTYSKKWQPQVTSLSINIAPYALLGLKRFLKN